jgi:uncharacterized protein YjiS (DUF1127 family)
MPIAMMVKSWMLEPVIMLMKLRRSYCPIAWRTLARFTNGVGT